MKVLFFLSIFFSLNIYSQKTIEPGIYLSNDGLEYIINHIRNQLGNTLGGPGHCK